MPVTINKEKCNGCGICYNHCPGDIFKYDKQAREVTVAYSDECWTCGACAKDCPQKAIQLQLWWKVTV